MCLVCCKGIIVSCTSCSNLSQLKHDYTILCIIRLSSSFFKQSLSLQLYILRSLLAPLQDTGKIKGLCIQEVQLFLHSLNNCSGAWLLRSSFLPEHWNENHMVLICCTCISQVALLFLLWRSISVKAILWNLMRSALGIEISSLSPMMKASDKSYFNFTAVSAITFNFSQIFNPKSTQNCLHVHLYIKA